MAPLLYPLIFLGIGKLTEMRAETQLEKTLSVPVVGIERAPNLMKFLASYGIDAKPAPADIEARVRAQQEDLALAHRCRFRQGLARRQARQDRHRHRHHPPQRRRAGGAGEQGAGELRQRRRRDAAAGPRHQPRRRHAAARRHPRPGHAGGQERPVHVDPAADDPDHLRLHRRRAPGRSTPPPANANGNRWSRCWPRRRRAARWSAARCRGVRCWAWSRCC